MPQQNGWEKFAQGVGDAIADIREKAYEEAWFGRAVTERGDGPHWPEAEQEGPQGMSGQVLPPEWEPSAAPSSAPQIAHGWVIDNENPEWPKAQEGQVQRLEQDRDRNIDNDIER